MASASQDTSNNKATEAQSSVEAGTLGHSNKASIKTIFIASPIHTGELDNVEDVYFNGGNFGGENVDGLNGTVSKGYGFSATVDMNYSEAPDMNLPSAGTPGGAPASAYVPNPTSPGGVIGTPTDNPKSKGAPPEEFINMDGFGGTNGGGPSVIDANGIPVTPKSTSTQMSNSRKLNFRGMSRWTEQQKIDMFTPVDPMSGKDI